MVKYFKLFLSIYIILFCFFIYLISNVYPNSLIIFVLIGLDLVALAVHAFLVAWKVGKAERELEAKEDFVAKAELEEKYEYYKHKRTGKN